MHENQRVHRSGNDQTRCNHSLSKSGWSTDYAVVMNEDSRNSVFLLRPQLALEANIDFFPCRSFVFDFYLHGMRLKHIDHVIYAPSWKAKVLGEEFTIRNNPRLAVCGEPHRSSPVEFWILESSHANQTIHHGGR